MGGKAEKGTPKYIANKIKAKGLQKLRWYCQMCQKQCRDENGFKCHTMSESHQRQLLLFADNANKYIDEFSKEFADGYLELLHRQFGTKRVNANKVYQEYISHRDHLHMNATQWETLTEFVKWLGREGKCVVDETEKGWFVAYIDRDPAAIAALESKAKKEKMDKDDQERMLEFIQKQVERGKKQSSEERPSYSEFKRESSQEKVVLSLKRKTEDKKPEPLPASALKLKAKEETSKKQKIAEDTRSKQSALYDIMKMQERAKEKANRKDYWICEDIIVKITTKSLGDKYYKKKAVVEKVVDKYCAHVKLTDDSTRLKLDQNHLETVIPSTGRSVRFVNGAYRGATGQLRRLDIDNFCCDVEISEGPLTGRVVKGVQYEDINKKPEPLPASALKLKAKEETSKKQKIAEDTRSKQSALDDIMKMQERAKEKANRKDYWICENIIVKITTKSLGDKYYKKKAVVEKVVDKYCAHVKLTDDNTRLKLDQNHLETVIPSTGRAVRFVNGAYRGATGQLRRLDIDNFCCDVEISEGPLTGRVVKGVQYEDISKLAS